MKCKKSFIILITMVFIILFVLSIIKEDGITYEVVTEYGDKFTIKEKVSSRFPEIQYETKIYNNSKLIKVLDGEKKFSVDEFTLFYHDKNIICYWWFSCFIWKENDAENFTVIEPRFHFDNNKEFLPIAKKVFFIDWEYSTFVSKYLLAANDQESIQAMIRYSNGEFTDDEIEKNRNLFFNAEKTIQYYKDLLMDY